MGFKILNAVLERMNIVITGHVDHGKSTLVGRLLADTHSLPQGKLENVKLSCEKNARPFEYSMLLDALEDEQKQGITIDSARIFFKTQKREYVIIDAPGHIEFLRNMLSGASRASAAVLVIDAKEGVAENSKRHGMLLSLLGISQVVVVINKLDIFDYSCNIFEAIKKEYLNYLTTLGVKPVEVIPISAREGVNVASHYARMDWYKGTTLLECLDSLHNEKEDSNGEFMMPLQDVYRFSNDNDERRIYAGSVVSGKIGLGERIIFLPSFKEATIAQFETWNAPIKQEISVNEAVGISLCEDIYVTSGEVMVSQKAYCLQKNSIIKVTDCIFVNLIWLGKNPFIQGREYLFKLGSAKVKAKLKRVERVLQVRNEEIEKVGSADVIPHGLHKNEAGSVILSLNEPVALTPFNQNQHLGRFVLVDGYDAAAGGIVLEALNEIEQDTHISIDDSLDYMEGLGIQSFKREKISESFEEELFALLHKYFPHRFKKKD